MKQTKNGMKPENAYECDNLLCCHCVHASKLDKSACFSVDGNQCKKRVEFLKN